MKQAWNDTGDLVAQLGANWRPFLAIHLAVTLLVFVLLAPLATVLLRMAVTLSGDAALSDQDILFFVLSPGGFVAFVVLVSIFSIIVFLEYAALIMTAWLVEKGKAVPVTGVLKYLTGQAGRLFGLAFWILLRVLLYSLPFVALLAGIYLALLSEFDINYYLSQKPSEWYTALALGGAVVLAWVSMLVYLASGWIFSLPLLLLGDSSPGKAIKASVEACRGQRMEIIRAVLLWLAFSIALGLLAALVSWLLSLLLLPSETGSINALLLALGFLSLVGFLESFLVSFISTSVLSLMILKLFRAYGLWRMADLDVYGNVQAASRIRLSRKAVIGGLIGGVLLATVLVIGLLGSMDFESETEVMAHRGASGAFPENTMAAIQGAIDSGAQWVEIDVQEAADGEIVVIHDSDLKKVGSSPLVVAESTVRELKWIDIGSWFDLSFSDERVPTLREVLELCKGRIGVNIELKYYGSERRLEQSVAELVDEYGMADDVIAMSLNLDGVREMKRVRPGWKVGLLSSVAVGDLAKMDVDFLALNARFATRQLVRRMHGQGKQVFVWTVNDALGISTMASRGVDAIITDEPALAVSLLEQRRDLDPHERMLLALAELFDKPSLVKEQ